MIAIVVESCASCPMHDSGLKYCSIGSEHGTLRPLGFEPFLDDRPPPDWCPLRENDRLVTLRFK